MFVRCKRNKSGSTSVQIIDKSSGRYIVHQTVGSSSDQQEIDRLIKKGKRIIESNGGQTSIPFQRSQELDFIDTFLNSLDAMNLVGPELLLGHIFNDIGFNAIDEELFKHLVITRIVYPVSKLKTTDYLMKYKGIDVSVYSIYRYLDKLHQEQIDLVKEISSAHTLGILGGKLSIVFYDVTTLYFEASDEDDLRKRGFSKDGKHQHPQIVLGLLVSENGYPLDYDIFEGNKYEGETMLPIIEHFTSKYSFENLVVVADSGLLSKSNIQKLKDGGYQYILGARIKNIGNSITEQILNLKLGDKESAEIKMEGEDKLIVGYKKSRASKDGKNRKRGLDKLEKAIQGGKLGKSNINNRGYNKYLTMSGEVSISINYDKYNDDSKWDGLKGYMTNCNLSKEDVIKQYSLLWNIERTFRISKSDLQIRPIFHRLRKRIESHICISFAACKVYKELERLLKEKEAGYSAEQAIEIIKTIYKVKIQTPYSEQIYERLIIKNDDQKAIVDLFDLDLN